MKKPIAALGVMLLLIAALTQSVWAFSDTKGHPNEAKIAELQKLGILSGDPKTDTFDPNGSLTYAAGISMIVNGLGLNLDGINFIKEPKVTDSFPNMKDDAWYANAFIIAAMNGLDIPRDTKASAVMTREQFAHHLMQALLKKGDYAFIDLYVVLKDEAEVNPDYMGSVQRLLVSGIAKLDDTQRFEPKAAITRGDAAGWLYDTIRFVATHEPIEPPVDQQPFPLSDLTLSAKAVSADVNEVTVSAQAPNPGYGIRIASIAFDGDQAVVYVEPIYPEKGKMYPQVITQVKAVTYVSSAYKAVLGGQGAGTGSSSGSSAGGSAGIIGSDGDTQRD
ncbi:S-layer homology domain-containing protein [Paenibacillus sp. UNC496MF]|uniref:S-layer homology domain-containing protein n=1 Tax=Paenibacillus sp. UNC496MF TaxID=1502753 RepID=UPI0008E2B1FF|nr:S-layer homology domain-containing protein [Paenibacillus sp. UNC496MF]SFI59152.1 S-layer homology domain-containing protein [Paenibacillus sp. UNC496MF]